MKQFAIEVKQLTHQFSGEDPLFSDLSFEVERGEFVSIIGPNGAGKTTLIKLIMGFYKPVAGEVHVYESHIGYVPQQINRDPFSPLTVHELFLLKNKQFSFWGGRKKTRKKIQSYLSHTHVEHLLDRQIKHLSGGELQRVMIAYALINNPGLLILDEPVSGIDIHGEQDFYDMLEEIHKEYNITILMISHDIDIVYKYATNVICLNKSLICQGVPSKVLDKKTIEQTFSKKHGVYHHTHDHNE